MTNHFVWKDSHSCSVPSVSAYFFSFASSASSTQTMQILFTMALFICNYNLKCPLSSSFLISFTAHAKSQPQKAILIISNSYFKNPPHDPWLHHLVCLPANSSVYKLMSPITWLDLITKYISISPQVFTTMFSSSPQISLIWAADKALWWNNPCPH